MATDHAGFCMYNMMRSQQLSCSSECDQRWSTHPSFAVDVGLLLQQELHHLDVAIVTRYMERGIAHLRENERKQYINKHTNQPNM